jgi:beta-lactamase regulating signal transducer with metallopeptidase domain
MNNLETIWIWLAIQVTLITLVGFALSALAARRTAAAGASAALTALAATIVLAALACCPLPAWWGCDALIASAADSAAGAGSSDGSEQASDAQAPGVDDSATGGGLRLSAWRSLLGLLVRKRVHGHTPATTIWEWPALVAAGLGVGMTVGLARLAIGLWGLRQGRRRSRPIDDPEVLRQVNGLREAVGVRRLVTVAESVDVAIAATIGWRRPILLLAPDWRNWSETQRRSAIAHELVHVRRGDFAAWLLARVSVAVHFWHPLVRGLARWLQLQQELAADADAARAIGGRAVYLRSLAELALRADGRTQAWPAPAFLSGRGTLLRRIAMLRVMDDGLKPTASRVGRHLAVGLLLLLTLTASALRGPVREALAGAQESAGGATEVVPFDPSLVYRSDKKTDGFFAARPAALLKRPGAESMVTLINAEIDAMTAGIKAGGLGIHVEDVEQVMGRVMFGGENKPGKRTLMSSLNMIRTVRDMDWVKLRDLCGPKLKQHQYRGETYVSFQMPEILMGLSDVRGDGFLWAADARTLIFDIEDAIKEQIDAKLSGKKQALPAYAAGWDAVSRGLFAIALDNRGGRIVERCVTEAEMKEFLADETKAECHVARFCKRVSHVVVGFGGADDFRFDLRAAADTPEAGIELARNVEAFLAAVKRDKAEVVKAGAEGSGETILRFLCDIADRATVRRDGAMVSVHSEVARGFNAVISSYATDLGEDKK